MPLLAPASRYLKRAIPALRGRRLTSELKDHSSVNDALRWEQSVEVVTEGFGERFGSASDWPPIERLSFHRNPSSLSTLDLTPGSTQGRLGTISLSVALSYHLLECAFLASFAPVSYVVTHFFFGEIGYINHRPNDKLHPTQIDDLMVVYRGSVLDIGEYSDVAEVRFVDPYLRY